ncbi:M28 family peptidase [Mycolicibacterium hodleri]|uniref:M28 family peptidase n=1 Tax=Mycolicibacterium hodleri TaxID=49897 RepID=A0A502DWH3_9MYCO|nr:M28 family peptidase [Mycolicibacterium hodleri]TPG29878.1 M28 family peptidase [Mycolicibacterium hodleri]
MRKVLALACLLLVTSCAAAQQPPAPVADPARALSGKVTVDGMYQHLQKLADIAAANGDSRADGTPGFDASVDYVAGVLRDKGFDVQTPEFQRLVMSSPGKPTLVVSGRSLSVDQASPLVTTPSGGLSAVTLRPQRAAGCTAGDYGSVDVRGAIAVVDDTACSVVDKQNAAVERGAVGVLVVSDPGSTGSPAGLFTPGYYRQLTAPVAVIDEVADGLLRRTSAPVRLTLNAKGAIVTSRSVVAQTKTGDPHNVVVAGAHLDSAAGSPGLNSNGSGIAAVLETAVQLGSSPNIANAVRFAFWGSPDTGLQGSSTYVAGLGRGGLDDVAMYLDFALLGSTNAGYFTLDGDQSGQPNPNVPAEQVPIGSAGVERTLAGYLNLAGVRPADQPLGLSGDYSAFLRAGIPIGGITTGSSQRKTATQARIWGGRAGVPFDPNYQTSRDTIANVDRATLTITGPAVAFAVGTYAHSTEGPNGVPARG